MVLTADGVPIRTTLDADITIQVGLPGGSAAPALLSWLLVGDSPHAPPLQYAGLVTRFTQKVKNAMRVLPVPPPPELMGMDGSAAMVESQEDRRVGPWLRLPPFGGGKERRGFELALQPAALPSLPTQGIANPAVEIQQARDPGGPRV